MACCRQSCRHTAILSLSLPHSLEKVFALCVLNEAHGRESGDDEVVLSVVRCTVFLSLSKYYKLEKEGEREGWRETDRQGGRERRGKAEGR